MSIILQPCANKEARQHYNDTVNTSKLKLEDIKDFISTIDYDKLSKIYSDGKVKVWGVVESNINNWNKISIGDISLFAANNRFFSSGVVCYKMKSNDLAEKLWGSDKSNKTWGLIYFLDEITNLSIPYTVFNKLVGYKENYIVQGFSVLNEEKSNLFLSFFPLNSDRYLDTSMSEEKYYNDIDKEIDIEGLGENLNVVSNAYRRKEQGLFRKFLLGDSYNGECAICGRELPVEFMWCSHIKKRSYCSKDEKLDYKGNIVPMCKLGCDDLFEKGYIGVNGNGIVSILKLTGNGTMDKIINELSGKRCSYFNEYRKKYFDYHYKENE